MIASLLAILAVVIFAVARSRASRNHRRLMADYEAALADLARAIERLVRDLKPVADIAVPDGQ